MCLSMHPIFQYLSTPNTSLRSHLKESACSRLISVAVIKPEATCGGRGEFGSHFHVTAHHWGKLGKAFEAQTTEECCLLSFCPWLAQPFLLHVAQYHLPRDGTTLSVLGPPTSINSWENAPTEVAASHFIWGSLFSGASSWLLKSAITVPIGKSLPSHRRGLRLVWAAPARIRQEARWLEAGPSR